MTNTKFRKRALLSSVAMLLVALVALGSATFAWFAESPNVKASGLILNTTASDGLEIQAELESNWSTAAVLRSNAASTAFNLAPASQVQNSQKTTSDGNDVYHGDTFYTMKAALPGEYGSGSNVIQGSSAGHVDQPVYKEDLFFRLTQTSSADASREVILTGVTIEKATGNTSDLANAIRVSICDANNKILGTYALATTGNNGTLPYDKVGKKVGATADADTVTVVAYGTEFATSVPAAGVSMATGVTKNSTKNGAADKKISVYVWLDGQDTDCFTNGVSEADVTAIISKITLNFSLKAA